MTNYIGIDIGGTEVKYALLDEKETITQAGKKDSPKTLEALIDSNTGHAVHGEALTFIRECTIMKRHPIYRQQVHLLEFQHELS